MIRDIIHRYFDSKKGRSPCPFPQSPSMSVHRQYVLYEHDLDTILNLAREALASREAGNVVVPRELLEKWNDKLGRIISATEPRG